MWQAVNKGWLNAVSSDHCGFDWKEQKHLGFGDFASIPNGAPGLENRLGVLWTQGVENGKITRSKLVDLYATTPAKVNGIGHCKGHIGLGYDADLVLYNPDHRSVISWETSLQGWISIVTKEWNRSVDRRRSSSVASWWWTKANTWAKKGRENLLPENPLGSAIRGYNQIYRRKGASKDLPLFS